MRSVRLSGLRSLVDTGTTEPRPITLLVGANSSGKSSYLRFYPLLRQTVETPSRGPLLWFGRLVDFGDFASAASRSLSPRKIGFEFDVQTTPSWMGQRFQSYRGRRTEEPLSIRVRVEMQGIDDQTYVSHVSIVCEEDTCILDLNKPFEIGRFQCNEIDVLKLLGQAAIKVHPGVVLPTIQYETDGVFQNSPVDDHLMKVLKEQAHNRTSNQTLLRQAARLSYDHLSSMLSRVRSLQLRRYQEPTSTDPIFKKLRSLMFVKEVPWLLRSIQRQISDFAEGVTYLGPFRQQPERFYRQQELAVGQIEPHGENFAMFLRSLSRAQIEDLSAFVHEYLGFYVNVRSEGSHVAVLVGKDQNNDFNLIDMGYGLSQVLPVIAQCWMTSRAVDRAAMSNVLAVEQPELHLHPSHQSKLADMFAAVARSARAEAPGAARRPLEILVETHSEAMVNRFGELVAKGDIGKEDVQVLLFEKDEATGTTTVKQSLFADDGTLQGWPLGFFAP